MIDHPLTTVSADRRRPADPVVVAAYLAGGLLAGVLMELASYTVVMETQIGPVMPGAGWFSPGYSAAALVVVAFALGFYRRLARYGFVVAAIGAFLAVGLYPYYLPSADFGFSETVVMNAAYGVVLGGVLLALRVGGLVERGALLAGFAAGLLMNAVLFRSPLDDAHWPVVAEGGLCALIFVVVGVIVRQRRVVGPTTTQFSVVAFDAVVDFVVVSGVVIVAGLAVVWLPVHPDRSGSGVIAVEGNGWLAPLAVAIGLVVVLLVLAVIRGGPVGGLAVLALVAAASPFVTEDVGLRIDWPMVYAAGGGVLVGWLAVLALRAAVPWEVLGYVVAACAMSTIGGNYLYLDQALTASVVVVAGVGLAVGAALTRLAAAPISPERVWRLLVFAVAALASVRTLMYHHDVFRSPVFGWVYGERTHWIWPAVAAALALALGVIAARSARRAKPRTETQAGETRAAETA
jgi:hypothetical protein